MHIKTNIIFSERAIFSFKNANSIHFSLTNIYINSQTPKEREIYYFKSIWWWTFWNLLPKIKKRVDHGSWNIACARPSSKLHGSKNCSNTFHFIWKVQDYVYTKYTYMKDMAKYIDGKDSVARCLFFSYPLRAILLLHQSWKPSKDRKRKWKMITTDRKRTNERPFPLKNLLIIFFSLLFLSFSIRLLFVSYPFAIHSFPILSQF